MIARPLVWLITGYRRWISPMFVRRCRFAPTCSEYAVIALQTHGAARGSWLSLRRLLRCQPFFPGGYDPVPPATRSPSAGPPAASRGVLR